MYLIKKNNKDRGFFEDFFNDIFDSRFFSNDVSTMKTDIREEGDKYLLDIDLPGFNKEDIKLSIEDGYLTIEAKHDETNEEKDNKGNYIRRERRYGSCSRSFYVGDLRQEEVVANYKNGILNIIIPKESEKKIETKKYIAIE